MKQAISIWLLALLFSCKSQPSIPAAQEPAAIDEQTELAAIMKVIEAETESFYQRDYESWRKNFSKKDYAFQAWNNSDGTADVKRGWAEVDNGIGNYIKANPLKAGETASHPKVERKNLNIHFFNPQLAYLSWDQYNSDAEMKVFTLSKDSRLMEKENGEWKILNVTSYWDYKNTITADSLSTIK